jgi:hypothetical protein
MSAPAPFEESSLPLEAQKRINAVCEAFEADWRAGKGPSLRGFVPPGWPLAERRALLVELLRLERHYRPAGAGGADAGHYAELFPELADVVRAFLAAERTLPLGQPPPAAESPPASLGGYRILRQLGAGTFGVVYQARDDNLQRDVAIKVARREVVAAAGGVDLYLREAQTLAKLRHPHVVAVHAFGSTEDGSCYIVSEFIQGEDLRARLARGRLAPPRRRGWRRPSPAPSSTPTKGASSTGTSSPPTSSSTAPASPTWPTSAWR